jgi:hypothetical protein
MENPAGTDGVADAAEAAAAKIRTLTMTPASAAANGMEFCGRRLGLDGSRVGVMAAPSIHQFGGLLVSSTRANGPDVGSSAQTL